MAGGRMTAAQKAAHTRKWRRAAVAAHARARNAKTFARKALTEKSWRCIDLDSRRGYEYKGVVDLVAVKRNNRRPDEFEVLFVQVKGGTARASKAELDRLERAARWVRVEWAVAEKPGKTVRWRRGKGER
jgi:hypothetical protein